jgi:hypothetical protein
MTLERIILKVTGLIFIIGGIIVLGLALYVSFGVGAEPEADNAFSSIFLFSIGAYVYAGILTALATGAALLGLDAVIGHLSALENSNQELVEQGRQVRRETATVSKSRTSLSAAK